MQMSNKNNSLAHCYNSYDKPTKNKSDKNVTFFDFDIDELFIGCFKLYKLDL